MLVLWHDNVGALGPDAVGALDIDMHSIHFVFVHVGDLACQRYDVGALA